MPPYDWANGDSVDVFGGGEYGFSNMEVDAILRNECGNQRQNYATLTYESETTAGFTTRIGFYAYNVLD